jgi:DNA-binding response OmpR family regulator
MNECHILIIGRSSDLELIKGYLQSEGFATESIEEVEQGVGRALSGQHALIILDMPPGRASAIEVVRRIRQQAMLPVMILSADYNDTERVLALEFGADDYQPKPLHHPELIARIRALLRRSSPGTSRFGHLLKGGAIELDKMRRIARNGGKEIVLTTVEFDLLEYLLKKSGQVVSREELAQEVLGRRLNSNDRSIDVHISNLRKKLEVDQRTRIKSIRGIGYSLISS